MLNKDGQRELCYVIKIDDIKPIQGRDKVECAVVGGWNCMVRKGQFQKGDLGIYFEIDSKVDTSKEVFKFTEKYNGKIKTQKFSIKDENGNKVGQFWSQGLLMSASDFGWDLIRSAKPFIIRQTNFGFTTNSDDLFEGDFLTQELGVTYAETEDNKRKSSSDKYKKMASRHPKLFKNPIIKKIYKTKWGKKLLFVFFGNKRDNKSEFPDWVKKTDEERCLHGKTKVLTDKGEIELSHIVNDKLDVKVLSVDTNGNLSYKKILDYQKFENNDNVITITYPYSVDTKRTNKIVCTQDHKLLTQRGYVKARDLTLNDSLFMVDTSYGEEDLGGIYGMLLGDSHIGNDKRSNGKLRIVATNGETQLDYLNYKKSCYNNEGKFYDAGIGGFGSNKTVYHWFLSVDSFLSASVRKDFFQNGRKQITENVINKINEEGLAFWYMDDGNLSHKSDKQSPSIRLNTQGFSLEENELLCNMLQNKFGIECHPTLEQRKGKPNYYHIYITTKSTPKFLKIVSPYMCKSMKYKTLDEYEGLLETKSIVHKRKERLLSIPIININVGQTKYLKLPIKPTYVYDLEVEDNHNFITANIVSHNCQNLIHRIPEFQSEDWICTEKRDGSSTTMTLKGHGRKQDYAVCSRNVRMENRKDGSWYDTNIYTEMADKYNIKSVLEDLLTDEYEFVTIQGETFGEGVQKRDYGLKEHVFEVFNVIFGYKDGTTKRLNPIEMKELMDKYNVPTVPIIEEHFHIPSTCQEILDIAGGEASIYGGMREGIVFRNYDATKSFKAVDNEFLAKYHG